MIVHTAFIGDVILLTALIRETKEIFQDSCIDVLVTPVTAPVLDGNPLVNSVISFKKKEKKIISFLQVLKRLRYERYDLAILPHSSFTTSILSFLSRIPVRIGFDRFFSKYLLTRRIGFSETKHRVEKNLDLLSDYQKKDFDSTTELYPSEQDYDFAGQALKKMDNGHPIIAVSPGSVWFTKRWPEKYYQELVDILTSNDYNVVLIGAPDEKPVCVSVMSGRNCLNLAGYTTILQSAAVIQKCNLVVCNDSGALHLANAMKTDVFAFFGPTVTTIGYYPFRENDLVFEVDLECRPCGSHGGKECPLGHHECMKRITPDFVFQKIEKKFGLK